MMATTMSKKEIVLCIRAVNEPEVAERALSLMGYNRFRLSSLTNAEWGSGNKAMRRAGQFNEPRNTMCDCGYCGCPHEVYSERQSDWQAHQKAKRGIKKIKGAK